MKEKRERNERERNERERESVYLYERGEAKDKNK